jgi:hypothetical protein
MLSLFVIDTTSQPIQTVDEGQAETDDGVPGKTADSSFKGKVFYRRFRPGRMDRFADCSLVTDKQGKEKANQSVGKIEGHPFETEDCSSLMRFGYTVQVVTGKK